MRVFLLSRKLVLPIVPRYAQLHASKLLYRELFIASAGSLYRETTPTSSNKLLHRDIFLVASKFVPRYASTPANLYLAAFACMLRLIRLIMIKATAAERWQKHVPCFASDGLRKLGDENVKSCQRPLVENPDRRSLVRVDSAPFTNTHRRAVSLHTPCNFTFS